MKAQAKTQRCRRSAAVCAGAFPLSNTAKKLPKVGAIVRPVLVTALVTSGLGSSVLSASARAASASQTPAPQSTPSTQESAVARLTDAELTDLAADWSTLDDGQRTELIQETRQRMRPTDQAVRAPAAPTDAQRQAGRSNAASANTNSSLANPARANPGVAPQATQRRTIERRRYGRLVRKADGSVVRIETQVVRIQGADPRRAYGVGFERRHSQPSGPDAGKRNDVITVQGPDAASGESRKR